ncbi:hypothetical protein [Nesterenkonia pannonica]|uniref:hypothetical protein n=1 Tax=Nesterenkonia pannonica TaxID=1548602 RepID=UPI00216420B1|nr:hypothetical protein [Nesterenkonia pannonica]
MWESAPLTQLGSFTDPVEGWLRSGPARAWHTFIGGRHVLDSGELQLAALEENIVGHTRAARAMQGLS